MDFFGETVNMENRKALPILRRNFDNFKMGDDKQLDKAWHI